MEFRTGRRHELAASGLLLAVALFALATPASAQIVYDGNILWNNGNGTLAGQFTGTVASADSVPGCPTKSALIVGTVDYTNNDLVDPLLTGALDIANPNWQPGAGSPAYAGVAGHGKSVNVPNDGFFTQVCWTGAIGQWPGEDWTQGWTYYDSTGSTRTDLHLTGMPDPRPLAILAGNFYASRTLAPDSNYALRGVVRFKDQTTLTIPAGVVIFGERATQGTLVIERGARINAQGTPSAPIIFTSDDAPGLQARGGWGGVWLLGRAVANCANTAGGDSCISEGGFIGAFGGTDDDDSSGILRYVRVEYAGKERSPNNELNAFTFCGVGDRTKGDYLQAFAGDDDGFEWFGGKMDSKHLIAIDGHDDGYDTQLGARTRSQFVIVRMSPGKSISGGQFGDKGIEADNTETSPFDQTVCAGRSFIQVANATFVGDQRLDDGTLFPGPTYGVHWRRGTSYTLLNSIVMNYKAGGLGVEHDATWNAHCAAIPANGTVFCGPPNPVGVNPITSGSLFVAFGAPNPFRNEVTIHFTLPEGGPVSVDVYSADGRHVRTLAQGEMSAGPNQLSWEVGHGTPAGMYFYRVVAAGSQVTGKLTRVN